MRRLASLLTLVAACFSDTAPAGDGGTTGAACPEGSAGCPCYGNMTCDGVLACNDGYCLDPDCIAGTENCPCLPSGGCDTGLVCSEGSVCKPEPGGTSSADASVTSIDPSTTAAEVGPGDSGPMSTTTDTNTGPLEASMSDVSTVSDSAVGCIGCAAGEICDPMGVCVSTDPYVPCAATGCDCLTGPSGEDVCTLACDPVNPGCPATPAPLAPATCYDPGNTEPFCMIDCGLSACPPEMSCALVTLATRQVYACMWQ
jgi:hypothetical protein